MLARMGAQLFNYLMFTFVGMGILVYLLGYAMYYFKFRQRSVESAIKVEGLPGATRLLRAGVLIGIVGAGFGLMGLLVTFGK